MKIAVSELLDNVGNEIDLYFSERISFPEDAFVLADPLRGHIRLTSAGEMVLLRGDVQAKVEQECSRCLRQYPESVRLPLEEVFQDISVSGHGDSEEGDEEGLSENDFVFPIEPDKTVDLGEAIRQNLILWLPMKPLCQEDCKGI